MDYKAICFDVDGTLYPPRLLKQFMLNITFAHPIWSARYGRMRQAFRECQSTFEQMGLSSFGFREREAMVLIKTMPLKNMKLLEARRRLDVGYYKHLADIYETLGRQPETEKTLRKIKEHGITTAVFSDWPLWDKLERMGLDSLIDKRYSPDDCGYLKPDVHCFEFVVDKLGLEAKDVLFVGDSYNKDIAGAAGAGLDAVLVGTKDEEGKYPLAKKVFADWEEFDAWIDRQLEA